jgi:hypothetical protein
MPTSVGMTAGVSLTKQNFWPLVRETDGPYECHIWQCSIVIPMTVRYPRLSPCCDREVVDSRADFLGGNPMTAMTMGSADYTASTATAVTLSVTCSTSAASTSDSDGDVPFGAASNSAS